MIGQCFTSSSSFSRSIISSFFSLLDLESPPPRFLFHYNDFFICLLLFLSLSIILALSFFFKSTILNFVAIFFLNLTVSSCKEFCSSATWGLSITIFSLDFCFSPLIISIPNFHRLLFFNEDVLPNFFKFVYNFFCLFCCSFC